MPHDHDMVHLGAVLAEHLLEPLELLAGHPCRNLALVALALFEHVHRDEQGILVEPVKRGSLHVVWAVEGHLEVSTKSIFVKGNRIRSSSPPWIIPDLVVTEGDIDLEIVILEALNPPKIILVRPLVDFLLLGSPVSHHEIARPHCEGRVFLLHRIHNKPEGVLPSLLGVLDIEIEKVGNAYEGPGSRIRGIGLGHQ